MATLTIDTTDIRHSTTEDVFSAAFEDAVFIISPQNEESFSQYLYNMVHLKDASTALRLVGNAEVTIKTALGNFSAKNVPIDVENITKHMTMSPDDFVLGKMAVQRGTSSGLIMETPVTFMNPAAFGARVGELIFDMFVSAKELPEKPTIFPPRQAASDRGFIAPPPRPRRGDRQDDDSSQTEDELLYVGQVRILAMDILPNSQSSIEVEAVLFASKDDDEEQGPRRLMSHYVSRQPSTMILRGREETTNIKWLKKTMLGYETSIFVKGAEGAMVKGATMSVDQLPFFGRQLEISSQLKMFNAFSIPISILYVDSKMYREGKALGHTILDWRSNPFVLPPLQMSTTNSFKLDVELSPQSMATFWESLQGETFVAAKGIVEARIEDYEVIVDYSEDRIPIG